ncbi:MAG: phosphoenolpyruvate--protein phosphotransferase [Candidatus Omnitrophica bacterium]|nr:phosphoenolpyruvate--protein phosphotransferase [Candidatus Omnitrophota bacterium]HOX54444.1 phosphoenolpyruvate--protein phosphotransferase [Candidatus Omnitrophota bacterium]
MSEIVLKGIPAASGVAIGPAFLFGKEEFRISPRKISEASVALEIARFEEALIKTRHEILEIQKRIAEEMGTEHAEIFDAHLLVLEDRTLIEDVIARIKREKFCVEYIFSEVLKKYISVFSKIEDEYLRERVSDINDVGKRILRNLLGEKKSIVVDVDAENLILVSYDLAPSDTASMYKKNIVAFVTDIGSRTSHTAIMAKSLEIPAVVGLEVATEKISNGDILIVDGKTGTVIVNPDKETLERYETAKVKLTVQKEKFFSLRELPAKTKDDREVLIAANIELPEEIPSVIDHGARGIGLYRTEYFYMNRTDLPSEEEHYQAYRHVAQEVSPHPVIIRTLDLGGDKFLSQLHVPRDMHPFLGWRAIRFCLARPDIFKIQLRAILRASVHGKLKLMYPMISGVEELRQANNLLEECRNELKKDNIKFDRDLEVGAMIEVPSAAITADIIAKEADFFSIGTNDLIQYSLAVDRTNEKIAYLYEPAHPAVLKLVKTIIDAGHKSKIWVGMCGEMSGDPELALVLLGLGLDEFSMPPSSVPLIKQLIRSVAYKEAKKIAEHALSLSTGKEVEEYSSQQLKKIAPELLGENDNNK